MRYRLRYFTPEQIKAALAVAGGPGHGACTDPDTLRRGAEIEAAAIRRIAAEAEAAAEADAGPDAA